MIDIGNTNTVLGVYDGDKLLVDWRLGTHREQTSDEYGIFLKELFLLTQMKMSDIKHIIISSVVPPSLPSMEEAAKKYFGICPLIVEPGIITGMPIQVDNPREVGADRIVNAVAAFEKHGGPLIVVDFGTATTFDVVSAKGEFLGGVIAPGMVISMEALFQRAAKLPRIELTKPKNVIGRNTISCMQSGIIYGYVGLVDELVNRIKAEMQDVPLVIATGGLSTLIAKETKTIDEVDPMLTLEGLRIIFQKNQAKKKH